MDDIQILETLPDGLVIQFRMPELKVDTKVVDGVAFQILSFRGSSFTHEVGKAQVPIRSVMLGIPDVSDLDVSVLDTQTSLLTGYRLYPVEKPVTRRESRGVKFNAPTGDGEYPSLPFDIHYTVEGGFMMDQEFYRGRRFYPADLAKIEPVGYMRQQRLARLELHPIQYSPSTGQLKVYKRLKVRVKFPMLDAPPMRGGYKGRYPASSIQHQEGVFEDLYRDTMLNYKQAKDWRKPRHERANTRFAPTRSELETRYKLTIKRDGMYRLDYNYLTRAGIDPGTMDPRKIELRSGGEPVPIYVEGYQDGKFDPGDFIEFYAVKTDSIYTDANVYWLSWSSLGSPGVRLSMMAIKDGTPKTPDLTPPVAFLDTEHWERDVFYDPLKKVTAETADHFFWAMMRGQDPRNDRKRDMPTHLPFRAPNINEPFKLRISFQGVTFARGASSHKVNIILNGSPVDTAQWEGQTEYISETTLSQINLHRTNWLTLYCEDNNGTSDTTDPKWDVYLNWIEIDYWRKFTAHNNRLEFSTETVPPVTKTVQYAVKGFSGKGANTRSAPTIEVFQIDRSGAIAKIINPKVEKAEEEFYTVVFEDKVDQPTRYFVTSIDSLMQPASIVKDQPSTLHDPANRIDYIMITHKNFRESAERLADFRRRQGLDVIVADIEDVYDEFSYGVFDPKAIKRFLRYAYFNWDKIPTYVLLIGDAHWDYKYVYHDYYVRYKTYPRIYVPTYHAWNPPFGQTAMDHRFVTVSGDDILPDMFIGRIPAESAEEANIVVDKIIKYEDRPYRGLWQSRVMLVADDEKSKSGDEVFEDSRVELANNYIPVGYDVVDVYLRRVGEPYIAKKIISMEINKGVIMLEYAGHGGAHSWAHEGIFGLEDVEKLQNYNRCPFVITTTCENGYFDNPMSKSIMEVFLLKPNAGAVACFSATRLTYGQGNATFDKILYPKIFSEKPPILGKIINAAKIDFINLGIATWVPSAEQYTLFGDPATRLALPELDIESELARSSVDPSKQLELKPGSVKRLKLNPLTGDKKLVTDTGFNGQMQISVAYPNNLDEDKSNDIPVQSGRVNIWKGEFDKVLLTIPNGVIPGEGQLKFYASSGNSSAIGGIRFSVSKPVIEFYSGRIINDESLQVYTAVVDNLGWAGIKSVECEWKNTETWKTQANIMVLSEAPPDAPEIEGSWYKLKSNIPLSRPGTSIEYKIKVMDTEGNEVISPPQKIKVPIGVNLAISRPEPSMSPSISYSYSQSEGAWTLSAPVENNGGKEVKRSIAVYFFEGNPDRNRDNIIDRDVKVLGSTVVEYGQWNTPSYIPPASGGAIQTAEALIRLDEPLYSGFHQIFVWINPRTDRIYGRSEIERVEDADSSDDKASRLFQINEFLVGKGDEATRAQSLDGTLSMVIPPGSVDETVMSITKLEPPESKWKQPDLSPAPIPEYGLDGGAFRIQLASGVTSLRKEAQIDIKFDAEKIRELAKKSKGLADKEEDQLSQAEREWLALARQEEAKKLGIYAWQEDIGVWRYAPSLLLMDEAEKEFAQEPYVTLPISENGSDTQLDIESVMVDEITTPLGNWIIFFLNSNRYNIYLRREGTNTYESLRYGAVGEIFYLPDVGLRLSIHKPQKDFRFGDVFKFDTYQDSDGTIKLKGLRNYNKGDGTARVTIMTVGENLRVRPSFLPGEWAIFFTGPRTFEVHSQLGHLLRDAVGRPVTGEVGKDVLIPKIGVKIEVHEGRWSFQFGDKILFKTLLAGTMRARPHLLNTMTLMHSSDLTLPNIQLWVNGLIPQNGAVIPPRPTISLLLSDANGIDTDSLSFLMSVDDRDFHPVPSEDYVFSDRRSFINVPIFYSPILNIGKYRYRITVMDFNGNKAKGNGDNYLEFMFLVEERPDLNPPTINVTVDGQTLMNGQVFHESPQFLINIDDDHALDESAISLSLAYEEDGLKPLHTNEYTMTVSDDFRNALLVYVPHLMNGQYAIQVEATDTSDNSAYLSSPEPLRFYVDEEVKVKDVMNAPNPFSKRTFFSYSLTQPADKVTIKIYTLRGKLVNTLERDLPEWQYNEEFWDGRDGEGNKLASGIYLYKFIVTDADRELVRIGKLAIVR